MTYVLLADVLTLESALLGGISALAGTAVFLFRQLQVTRADMDARFKECEDDRRLLWQKLYAMQSKMGETPGV